MSRPQRATREKEENNAEKIAVVVVVVLALRRIFLHSSKSSVSDKKIQYPRAEQKKRRFCNPIKAIICAVTEEIGRR